MSGAHRAGSIHVVELAIDSEHARGFDVVRPSFEHYTFSHYDSPIVLLDRSGVREWPAGVSIVHAPGERRQVAAVSADLLDTWFHFSGDGVESCLMKYGVPTNTVLDLGDLPFLKPILEEVRYERIQQSFDWEDAVADLIRSLFRELASLVTDLSAVNSPAQQKSIRLLHDIRMKVHSDISHKWTVAEMAAIGNLHPTWFATIYKQQFGSSPIDDLLDARLKHAEHLLRHLPIPVSRVATQCGFTSVEHFTRLFRKRLGRSPGQLRK